MKNVDLLTDWAFFAVMCFLCILLMSGALYLSALTQQVKHRIRRESVAEKP